MPPIRAWFFDAVGTLIRPEPSAAAVYAAVGRRHGSRLAADVIAARFREAFRIEEMTDRETGWRTSEGREVLRWRHIVQRVLDDLPDPESCFEELWDHFARPSSWCCEDGSAEVLVMAERRGLVLGMASNFDGRLHGVAAGLPELRPLRHIVVSSEVGWRKPSLSFFTAVVQASGLRPEEVLYIGDDYANDWEGAQAAGLARVLYDPADRHRGLNGRRIRSLREMLSGD